MNDPWIIYFFASTLFVGLGFWLLHRWITRAFSIWVTIVPAIVFLIIFITPVGVPETTQLAPAWLVVIYETAFGKPEMAQRALKPLYWSLLLCGGVLLSGLLVRRLTRTQQSESTNS